MYILFDIGSSKTRVSLTDKKTEEGFLDPVIFDTPQSLEEVAEQISLSVENFGVSGKVEGAFGGVSGVRDETHSIVHYSVNRPSWSGQPVKDILEKKLGVEVNLENDADLVGLGEAVSGAGINHSVVVYITVSTGVGGVRIVDGRIDSAIYGFEPGFQIIDSRKPHEYESTLEGKISGTAFERKFGCKAYQVTNNAHWEQASLDCAIGLYNSILHWSPELVVLGGSMIVGTPGIPVDLIAKNFHELGSHLPNIPEIRKAELGSIGGIYGALAISNF